MANLLVKLGIISMLSSSCAEERFYARRDYDQYPDYKKEIAEYNIMHILGQNCEILDTDENGRTIGDSKRISCRQCIEYSTGPGGCNEHGRGYIERFSIAVAAVDENGRHCVNLTGNRHCKIIKTGGGLFRDKEINLIFVRDQKEAEDLAEAIRFYFD